MKTYTIYSSYKELPMAWDSLTNFDIFLQSNYLKALEEASPDNIQLFYVGVFKDQGLVGVAIIQHVQLYLKDMFRNNTASCLKEFIQNTISKVLKGNILVIGNLTHTGQHGLFYNHEAISQLEFITEIFKVVKELRGRIKFKNRKTIRLILFKDYFLNDKIHDSRDVLNKEKFYQVKVQPNMILYINPNWSQKEDYINSLNKKYKTRYNRARKKLNSIERKELDVETIKLCSNQLHELYINVSNNARINTFILPKNHFYNLKQELQSNFRIFGYYLNDQLIGFYTLILNNGVLETYFLGYDSEHKYPNQLYLNMLYDMTEFAIVNKFSSVVYARTAMEIKSSVGAKPEKMIMYLKHTNTIINTILKQVFNLMNPKQKWVERHPFTT